MNDGEMVELLGSIGASAGGLLVFLYLSRRADRLGRQAWTVLVAVVAVTGAFVFLGSDLVDGFRDRIGAGTPDPSTEALILHELVRMGLNACVLGAAVLVIESVDLVQRLVVRTRTGR